MTTMTGNPITMPGGTRLSPGLWWAATAELGIAVAVGAVLLRGHATTVASPHPSMSDMHHGPAQIHWTAGFFVSVAVATAFVLGWTIFRRRALALGAAGGLIAVVAAEPVRTLALQSHLIAMTVLEAVVVAVPLLLVAGVRRHNDGRRRRSTVPAVGVVAAVLANSALLIVLHLPAIHGREAGSSAVPGWLIAVAGVIGVGYWSAILLTEGVVAPALRRAALTIGQEVAAILGLAALIMPAAHAHQANPLGLSAATDQRLGGVLMLITCAAVTLPLVKRLAGAPAHRTELHVH